MFRTMKMNHMLLLCLFAISCVHCTSDSNGDDNNYDLDPLANTPWPMVSHDVRHTGRSPYRGPQTATIKWIAECEVRFTGSAAIDRDGNILVGTYNEGLFCYSPDGTLLWVFKDADFLRGTPAIGADGTIYLGESYNHFLLALNPDGTFKWGLGSGYTRSSPAIGQDGTIYICGGGCLYAVDPDGSIKWTYCINYIMPGSPAIDADGNIIIGAMDRYLYAIKPDGSLLWKYKTDGTIATSVSIADDGTIYCLDKRNYLHALSPDGDGLWKKYLGGGIAEGSPAIGQDGTIYLSNEYELFAYNPDGSLKWQTDTVAYSNSTPAIGNDGTIYIHGWGSGGSGQHKTLIAVNPEDGSRKWGIYLANSSYTSPAIDANGTLYVGSMTKFYAFQDEQAMMPTLHPIGYFGVLAGISVLLSVSFINKGQ